MVITLLNLGFVITFAFNRESFITYVEAPSLCDLVSIVLNVPEGTTLSHKFLNLVSSFRMMWLGFAYIVVGTHQVSLPTILWAR